MKHVIFLFVFAFSASIRVEATQNLTLEKAVADSSVAPKRYFSQVFPKKSQERKAFYISTINTVLPAYVLPLFAQVRSKDQLTLNLMRYGFVIGPSGGSLYALDWKRTLVGSSLRFVGGRVLVQHFFACWEPGCTRAQEKEHFLKSMLGASIYISGLTYSIGTIPLSIEASKKRRSSKANVTITPTLIENPRLLNQNRDVVGGMRLELNF